MNTVNVGFTQMKDATQADYDLLEERLGPYLEQTPQRIMDMLARQVEERESGYQVNRLEHALQSATRARRSGADTEWVVAALIHDIGDGIAPMNHDKFAAEVLRPYVRPEVTWTVAHHGIFQLYYTGVFQGKNNLAREKYKDELYYSSCVDFCEHWDQVSFDPDYSWDPLDSFAGELHEVFLRTPFAPETVGSTQIKGVQAPQTCTARG